MKKQLLVLTYFIIITLVGYSNGLPPLANDDTATVQLGNSVTIYYISNDSDPDGPLDTSSMEILDSSPNGIFTINSDGSINYLSINTETGLDSFRYRVSDTGSPLMYDTALIIINTINTAPIGSNPCNPTFYDFSSNGAGTTLDTIPGASAANTFGMSWSPSGTSVDFQSVVNSLDLNDVNIPVSCITPDSAQSTIWVSFATVPKVASWQWQLVPQKGNSQIKFILFIEDPCSGSCGQLTYFKCGDAFTGWDDVDLTIFDPNFSYTYHLLLWSENAAESGAVNLKVRLADEDICAGSSTPTGISALGNFQSDCIIPGSCYNLSDLFTPSTSNGDLIKVYYGPSPATTPESFCPLDTNSIRCPDTTTVYSVRVVYGSCVEQFEVTVNVLDEVNSKCPGSVYALDVDDDNDGILDIVEICGVGATDFSCLGTCTDCDPFDDDDLDGTENYMDSDFCTLNSNGVCNIMDSDGDGIINSMDLDSDNDGILDSREAQGNSCYIEPSEEIDNNGLPLNMVAYTNCDDAASGETYGITPNDDSDDADGIPDYLDFDSDGDGSPDWVEGFDYIINYSDAIDDYIHYANNFENANGNPGYYLNSIDSDNDLIPDWLDNDPTMDGWDSTQLPPFQDPSSIYYYDSDLDGIVDMFDGDNNGTPQIMARPDYDNDGDFDWRSTATVTGLPVSLIEFNASFKGVKTELTWESGVEINFSHYEIERSQDGLTWEYLKEVVGKGHGSNYKAFDHDITQLSGITYYRLKMIDVDRTAQFSPIEVVMIIQDSEVNIYPNPTKHLAHISGANQYVKRIIVYNTVGQIVQDQILEESKDKFEVMDLQPGIYIVQIEIEGFYFSRSMVISE